MSLIVKILATTEARAMGLALLHFLWQGTAVAILLSLVLGLLREKDPQLRYAASCAALLLMLLCPALTLWSLSAEAESVREVDETAQAFTLSSVKTSTQPALIVQSSDHVPAVSHDERARVQNQPLATRIEGLLPWLTLVWLLGVLVLSARMAGGLLYAQRLKSQKVSPAAELWQARLREIAQRLGIRKPVALLESGFVQVPTVIGYMRPAILLPASAFVGLTPQQLELILAHELAHIRRHDYLINLLQSVAETLLFYHPAVWWVSREVRREREHVCDDLAVAACGDALSYARALTTLERLRQRETRLALAASGGNLRARILRLVESQPRKSRPRILVSVCLVAAFCVMIACVALSQKRRHDSKRSANAPTANTNAAKDVAQKADAENSRLPGEIAELISRDRTTGEDEAVRRAAINALDSHAGTVVVMEPQTGRVLAVVNQEWALRRTFTPASLMKLVTSIAGVTENLFDPEEKIRTGSKFGPLNLTSALAVSDNPYFKSLGERVGPQRIARYAQQLGLGQATGINYEGESAGRLPEVASLPSGGRFFTFGDGVEVTPIQLAVLVSAIANGGNLVVPRVPQSAEEAASFEPRISRRAEIPRASLEQVVPGMLAAVERGTGLGAKDTAPRLAGKTGTVDNKERSIGIFASYAPADNPRLCVVVVTEGNKESGAMAATLAGAIYRSLKDRL